MKNFVIPFFFFLAWSVIGLRWYVCNIKQLCYVPPETEYHNAMPGITINETALEITYDENIEETFQTFQDHLSQYPDQELQLTGLYGANENELIGLARAEDLKNKLMEFGLEGDMMVAKSEQGSLDFDEKRGFPVGVLFDFVTLDKKKQIERGFTRSTLFSDFATIEFIPDALLDKYTELLRLYLEEFPNATVQITGHTDIIGDAKQNLELGRARALYVEKYLIEKGIPQIRLYVGSKGEEEPISKDKGEKNQKINRRIEIKIVD